MKSILQIIFMTFLLLGCASSNRILRAPSENIVDISQDEEEYELIILDPGFEAWFATSWSPARDRSVSYYSSWNNQYVSAWNYKAMHGRSSQIFDSVIQYDPTVNYGIEVERKLYYYFRWVDTKLGIPILNTRPPGGIL